MIKYLPVTNDRSAHNESPYFITPPSHQKQERKRCLQPNKWKQNVPERLKLAGQGYSTVAENIKRRKQVHQSVARSASGNSQWKLIKVCYKKYSRAFMISKHTKAERIHLQTCCRERDKNKPWVRQTACIKNTLSVATLQPYSVWKSLASVQVDYDTDSGYCPWLHPACS